MISHTRKGLYQITEGVVIQLKVGVKMYAISTNKNKAREWFIEYDRIKKYSDSTLLTK